MGIEMEQKKDTYSVGITGSWGELESTPQEYDGFVPFAEPDWSDVGCSSEQAAGRRVLAGRNGVTGQQRSRLLELPVRVTKDRHEPTVNYCSKSTGKGIVCNTKGITIIELTITILIVGVAFWIITRFMSFETSKYEFTLKSANVRNDIRVVSDFMSREILAAGYNPKKISDFKGIKYSPKQLEIRADLNKDGNVDDYNDANEHVYYWYDSAQAVLKRRCLNDTAVILENITSFDLKYRNENGARITSWFYENQIREVELIVHGKINLPKRIAAGKNGKPYIVRMCAAPRNLMF